MTVFFLTNLLLYTPVEMTYASGICHLSRLILGDWYIGR